jgi:hypothetical protein
MCPSGNARFSGAGRDVVSATSLPINWLEGVFRCPGWDTRFRIREFSDRGETGTIHRLDFHEWLAFAVRAALNHRRRQGSSLIDLFEDGARDSSMGNGPRAIGRGSIATA